MQYSKIYAQLIANAQMREPLQCYVERHHIVPRSLGGADVQSNIVALTAREHFIAHCLLARIHGGTQWAAIVKMKGSVKRYVNSRLYATAKQKHAVVAKAKMTTAARIELSAIVKAAMTPEIRTKISIARKGKSASDIAKLRMSLARKGSKRSAEIRAKMSIASKLSRTPEVCAKISAAQKGKPRSEEMKAKISAATKQAMMALQQRVIKQFAFGYAI